MVLILSVIYNRLLKTSIVKLNRIFFREDIFHKEDGLFLIEYLCKSNGKVAHNSQSLYKYLQNPNSAMHVIKKGYIQDYLQMLLHIG